MQSLDVSHSAFRKHTCTTISSSQVLMRKMTALQQLLELLVFQMPLRLSLFLYFCYQRFLVLPLLSTLPPQKIQGEVLAVWR